MCCRSHSEIVVIYWLATRRDMFSPTACEALSRLHTDVKATFDPKLKAESIGRAQEEIGVAIAFMGSALPANLKI